MKGDLSFIVPSSTASSASFSLSARSKQAKEEEGERGSPSSSSSALNLCCYQQMRVKGGKSEKEFHLIMKEGYLGGCGVQTRVMAKCEEKARDEWKYVNSYSKESG